MRVLSWCGNSADASPPSTWEGRCSSFNFECFIVRKMEAPMSTITYKKFWSRPFWPTLTSQGYINHLKKGKKKVLTFKGR